jgi:glyoxylase-like metal-dependent hydrolase (beta-lactamase superfamily II)
VRPGLWCFAPSRELQGGTAWLLELRGGLLLVDCPALTTANLAFLETRRQASGDSGWIVLTSREGHGKVARLRERLPWPVLVQEQEAYLLPNLPGLTPWGREHALTEGLQLLWTPGPTPGSCVVHAQPPATAALDLLFCGRLLAPTAPGQLAPLRQPRTFHWGRQQRSLVALRRRLPAGSPAWIACGGGLGALRGEKLVGEGSALLDSLAARAATAA